MGVVDVAHFEACALSGQPAGAERRKPPLVGELRQRVGLVHELRQLRAAEELAHRRHDGAYVDERRRRGGRGVELGGHALFDDALHPHKPDADLVLYQLAHCAHAAVFEMVYVVRRHFFVVYPDHAAQKARDVVRRQREAREGVPAFFRAQLAVQLVAPHAPQVVAARVEEEAVDEVLRVLHIRRLAGAQAAVELEERRIPVGRGGVLLDGRSDEPVDFVVVHVCEQLFQALVELVLLPHLFGVVAVVCVGFVVVAQAAEQRADRRLALAVNLDCQQVAVGRLELHPRPAIGDELGGGERPAGVGVGGRGEVNAGRAHQLAHHHALRAVDDERAGLGHHRNVADEQGLLFDFAPAGPARFDFELDGDVEGGGEGGFALAALVFGELRRLEVVVAEAQLEPSARKVFYGRNLVEQLAQPFGLEVFERVDLHLNQVRHAYYRRRAGVLAAGHGAAVLAVFHLQIG